MVVACGWIYAEIRYTIYVGNVGSSIVARSPRTYSQVCSGGGAADAVHLLLLLCDRTKRVVLIILVDRDGASNAKECVGGGSGGSGR